MTKKYDVPLMVARGYASETFLHAAGEYMESVEKPCFSAIYISGGCPGKAGKKQGEMGSAPSTWHKPVIIEISNGERKDK